MICKECGAYNPDHASFCKVCAASLKDAPAYEEPEAESPETPSQDDFSRPSRTFAKPPAWKPTANFNFEPRTRPSANLLDEDDGEQEAEQDEPAFRPTAATKRFRPVEPVDEETEDEEEDEPAAPAPVRKPAAPAKRSYAEDDDEEEEDEEEVFVRRKPAAKPAKPVRRAYEEDDEEDDDEDDDEPVVRKKPAAKPAKPAKPVRRSYEEDDEEDEDDDEDDYRPAKKAPKKARRPVEYDDEDDDEDDEDDYTPRKSKGSSSIFTILLVVLLVLILAVVAIVVLANNVPSIGENLPMLKIDACAGTEPVTANPPVDGAPDASGATADPAASPDVTADAAYIEDSVNVNGEECVKFCVRVDVGETLTIDLPNQEDYTVTNTDASAIDYKIEVPKQAFNPNMPLDTAEYTVNPNVTLTDASGNVESLNLPFTINFSAITLSITSPVSATGEPIMAAEGNVVTIEGKVDTHTVAVSANGQPLSVYEDGYFKGDYTLQGEAAETIVVTATQDNRVSASAEIAVTPYVFVPKEMSLTMVKGVAALRADGKGVVAVKGQAEPGATLVATSSNEKVLCGSVSVDVSGNFTFNATFNDGYYGIANITVSAVKEGFVDASDTCVVTRMYTDRGDMTKNKNYYEIPAHKSGEDLVANPTQAGYFRITIRLDEVSTVDGYTICKVSILQSGKDSITAYVMNQSTKWEPTESRVGNKYNIYCMLNGLYPDTENLYLIAFFAVAK